MNIDRNVKSVGLQLFTDRQRLALDVFPLRTHLRLMVELQQGQGRASVSQVRGPLQPVAGAAKVRRVPPRGK